MNEDYTKAKELEEIDKWRLRALNLEIDNLELQRQIILLQSLEKQRQLQTASLDVKEKYAVTDPRQINIQTGVIDRGQAEDVKK